MLQVGQDSVLLIQAHARMPCAHLAYVTRCNGRTLVLILSDQKPLAEHLGITSVDVMPTKTGMLSTWFYEEEYLHKSLSRLLG